MNPMIARITLVAAVLLAPVAWWQDDLLIVGLAGLIPFFAQGTQDNMRPLDRPNAVK
jgi:hypothetical protein